MTTVLAILNGLNAPADVASIEIDARAKKLVTAAESPVERRTREGGRIEFLRRDSGLPLSLGLIGLSSYRFVPISDKLSRYMLAVRNLLEGPYEVIVDGPTLGALKARQLAGGVNPCSATPDPWVLSGPWDAQATVLRNLADARHEKARDVHRTTGIRQTGPVWAACSPDRPRSIDRLSRCSVRWPARASPYGPTTR